MKKNKPVRGAGEAQERQGIVRDGRHGKTKPHGEGGREKRLAQAALRQRKSKLAEKWDGEP